MERERTILIVDDGPNFVLGLQAAFERRAYRVITAANRAQAQEIVRLRKPDAILLGTIDPMGDASLFHKWLRQTPAFSNVPLIVVDAPVEKRPDKGWRRDEGLIMDSDDFAKSVELPALWDLVEKMFDPSAERTWLWSAQWAPGTLEGVTAKE